jgi:hypothetical protein
MFDQYEEDIMAKRSNRSRTKSEAVFIGWQEGLVGTRLALFNITADGHPSNGSTVGENTLRKLDIQVPAVPFHESKTNESRSSNNEWEMREE